MFAVWPSVVRQLLDRCGVVVLLLSLCVRRVLEHPLGGLCGRGYRG